MGNHHSRGTGKRSSQLPALETDGASDDNQIDPTSDLFKVAEKWSQLTKSVNSNGGVANAPNVVHADENGISQNAFENYFHEPAPVLGTLLFQHFQRSARSAQPHSHPSMLTQKAFVRNLVQVSRLTTPHERIDYYFRVFSRGIGTLHDEEMLLLLTVSVKVASAVTGLSSRINDADQQVFHALVRSLGVDPGIGVNAAQFDEWMEKHDVHLLNCLHHFVVQSLTSCSGSTAQEAKTDLQDHALPLLDQDTDQSLQLSSTALLWVLSCALPRLYMQKPSSDVLVDAANLTTWTLLYNSDKHGFSMNRFLHHTLHYNGPTISIYVLKSGSTYCIAVDTEWRESHQRFGGTDCAVYQIQPQFKRLEEGANLVYLNDKVRFAYRGIEIGADPERPVLKVESDLQSAVNQGLPDELVCVEVWGCFGSAPKTAQLDQIRWENGQAENMQKVPRPKRWEDNEDKYILDLAKHNKYQDCS